MKTIEIRPQAQQQLAGSMVTETSRPVRRASSLRIRSILVPTDFSPASNEALKYAAALAGEAGARITLLHVVEPLPSADLEYYPLMLENEQVLRQCRRALEDLPAHEGLSTKLFARPAVQCGVPFHEITSAARSLGVDLIVLATHGFTGFKRAFLGSTAERVARHASCPVLAVRPVEADSEQRPVGKRLAKHGPRCVAQFRRILVPVDFSDRSKTALRYATRFAEQFGGVIDLVYVIESIGRLKEAGAIPDTANLTAAAAALRCKLAELANEEVEELVPTSAHVETGKPSEQIIAVARAQNADLIIISTHGRSGMKHVFLGSVAESVLRAAPCPVLVVRQHERDFA